MNEKWPDNKTELKFKKWMKIKLFERLSHTKGIELDAQSNRNLNKYKIKTRFNLIFLFFHPAYGRVYGDTQRRCLCAHFLNEIKRT